MFCPNCGTNNREGVTFCAECGAPLNTAQAMGQQPGRAPSRFNLPLVVGLSVALVLAIGVGAFALVSRHPKADATTENTEQKANPNLVLIAQNFIGALYNNNISKVKPTEILSYGPVVERCVPYMRPGAPVYQNIIKNVTENFINNSVYNDNRITWYDFDITQIDEHTLRVIVPWIQDIDLDELESRRDEIVAQYGEDFYDVLFSKITEIQAADPEPEPDPNEPEPDPTDPDKKDPADPDKTTDPDKKEPVDGKNDTDPDKKDPADPDKTTDPDKKEPVDGKNDTDPDKKEPVDGKNDTDPDKKEPVDGKNDTDPDNPVVLSNPIGDLVGMITGGNEDGKDAGDKDTGDKGAGDQGADDNNKGTGDDKGDQTGTGDTATTSDPFGDFLNNITGNGGDDGNGEVETPTNPPADNNDKNDKTSGDQKSDGDKKDADTKDNNKDTNTTDTKDELPVYSDAWDITFDNDDYVTDIQNVSNAEPTTDYTYQPDNSNTAGQGSGTTNTTTGTTNTNTGTGNNKNTGKNKSKNTTTTAPAKDTTVAYTDEDDEYIYEYNAAGELLNKRKKPASAKPTPQPEPTAGTQPTTETPTTTETVTETTIDTDAMMGEVEEYFNEG